MEKIAAFEKVSFAQFEEAWKKNFPETEDVKAVYDAIKMPKSVLIPTGIRSKICDGWVLKIYPRSGLGFKHRVQLDNTVGIIDADYYNSSNEGHIMIKLSCDAHDDGHTVELLSGDGFAQGIFLQFGITFDDNTDGVRDGGFGSTTKK